MLAAHRFESRGVRPDHRLHSGSPRIEESRYNDYGNGSREQVRKHLQDKLRGETDPLPRRKGEGYTHLRATCPKCGRIADVPWPLLIGRKGTNRNTFLGNIPSRCYRCGNTTPVIGLRHLNSA
jgi:hypothetical protein